MVQASISAVAGRLQMTLAGMKKHVGLFGTETEWSPVAPPNYLVSSSIVRREGAFGFKTKVPTQYWGRPFT